MISRIHDAISVLRGKPPSAPASRTRGSRRRQLTQVLQRASVAMGRGPATDGWQNTKSGIGTGSRDRGTHNGYAPPLDVDRETALHMWRGSSMVRRALGKKAAVALSRGVNLSAGAGDVQWLEKELRRLGTLERMKRGRWWGNLYGGSLLIANCDGGGDTSAPLDLEAMRSVVNLRVVDRWQVQNIEYADRTRATEDSGQIITTMMLSRDGEPESYQIRGNAGSVGRWFHHSRVFRFDGAPLPWEGRRANGGWDDSLLISIFEALGRYGISTAALATMLQDANVAAWKIKGLHDMMLEDGKGEIEDWIESIILFRSILGDYALDADSEDFDFKARPLDGAVEVYEQLMYDVAQAVDMPFTELFGRSPAGMNATGESDRRKWHETIDTFERPVFGDALGWLLPMLQAQTTTPQELRGEEIIISWPSLDVPTFMQEEEKRNKRATTNKILADEGVLGTAEWRRQLRTDSAYVLDEDEVLASGGETLSPLEKLRQGRLVAQSGLLYREREEANLFRDLLGMEPWSEAARESFLEAMIEMGLEAGAPSGGGEGAEADAASGLYHLALRTMSQVGAVVDAPIGDGSKVGLFIRLPEQLASQRSPMAVETSPPHVTFLMIGDVRGREVELFALIRRLVAEQRASCRALLRSLDTLQNQKGQTVMYQHVDFIGASRHAWPNPMEDLRDRLVEALRAEFFPVIDIAPECWLPHLTLAYLDDPRGVFSGVVVDGSWHVSELEVWGLGEPVIIPLDPPE